MRFFFPTANDLHQAEHLYDTLRQRVHDLRGPVTDKRIYLLKFRCGERVDTLAVGGSFRALGGEPVLAIFEVASGYEVCTWHHGAFDGEPLEISRDAVITSEPFRALA